jgi:hypothetical protein
MDAREAALQVLAADPEADLHWTVIWDRALRAGLIDPRTDPDARAGLMRALADAAREGVIRKTSTGTYRAAG